MPPTYDLLGYKRLIVDYHFSDYVSGTLADANAEAYVNACVELGTDSVLVYAKDHWGNCYFATPHYPRHLNVTQDLFGEVLAGLRENGIVGFAYFSVSWDEHIARRHPEWVMRAVDGTQIRRGAPIEDRITGRWRYLCMNSPVRDYLLEQIAELIGNYDFPALFLDILFMNPAGQICHCSWCQERWREQYGIPLPESYTPEYLAFITETLGNFQQDVRSIIAASGKHIQITHNFGLPYDYDDYLAFEFNTLGRNFLRGSAIAKIMRAQAAGREVELIGHRFNQDWDFTTKSPVLMRWEAATVLAHNCALMWVDQPHMDGSFDSAGIAAMKASYEVVDELLPHVRGSKPYAEIALLYPARSMRLEPDQELDFVGAYRLLSELHWPFDVISEEQLNQEQLQSFRLLIIPSARHLSAEAVSAVSAYVKHGGHLLFTHQTATASPTQDHLPTDSFGMVQILEADNHPASFLRPFGKYPCGNEYLRVTDTFAFRALVDAETCATFVEPNITVTWDQWVSHNVAPGTDTGRPAVIHGTWGKGQFIYAAPRLFAEYGRQGLNAIATFVTALLSDLAEPDIWVEAPKSVEATYNRQGDDLVVVLINGITNRPVRGGVMMLGDSPGDDSIDEIIPVHDIRLHVQQGNVLAADDMRGEALAITLESESSSIVTLESLAQYDVIRMQIAARDQIDNGANKDVST